MDALLLVIGGLVCLAVLGTGAARRWGVPSLVLFVGLGMLVGTSGPGGVPFSDYQLAYDAGTVALAFILLAGGLHTELPALRRAIAPALALSTVGVLVKTLVAGGLALLITPLEPPAAFLLGAVLAPTDAAAVFSVLAGAGLPKRLKGLLETESGTNDPMAIYLTLALTTMLTGGAVSVPSLVGGVVVQLGLGLVVGIVGGLALARIVSAVRLDSAGLYPVLVVGGALATFGATNLLGGNGFLAVYVAGITLAHRRISHLLEVRTSVDTLAWAAQIGMFLMLGLLAFPERLASRLGSAALLAAGIVVVARPLSVLVSLGPLGRWRKRHRYSRKERLLLSWAGLKGAVPIILATVPLLHGVPQGELLFDYVFVVVIVSTVLQGTTTVPLARWLGLLAPPTPEPDVRLALAGHQPSGATLTEHWLAPGAPAVGRTLAELGLPDGVVVAAVVRGRRLHPARGALSLSAGDHMFLVLAEGAALPAELEDPTDEDECPPDRDVTPA